MITHLSKVVDIPVEQDSDQSILVGEEVFLRLEDKDFLNAWDLLLDASTWATVFQGKEFVTTWYKINRQKITPILIISYSGTELTGLLALAKRNNRKIFGAGLYDTEYQVWLAHPDDQNEFMPKALLELEKRFKYFELELRFIPPKTPLQWINENRKWKNRSLLRTRTRPLMQIDPELILKELRKKNRKEKVNRLKRLGTLSLTRITDPDAFFQTFDVIADQFNFRKAARYNSSYFLSDPNKKAFYTQLFEHNLLHVTVLKLNNEIIAANVGIAGKNWVHLKGMNTWSPFYAKHSPGIIHFLMLGQKLSEEGYSVFDLTPGDDPYKEVLATNHDEVHELWVYSHRKECVKNLIRKGLYFKILKKYGTTPIAFEVELQKRYLSIRNGLTSIKQQGLKALRAEVVKQKGSLASPKLFEIDLEGLKAPLIFYQINKNCLRDFLNYEPCGTKIRCDFLTEAMKKYEASEHSYTVSEDKRLIACIWLKRVENETMLPSKSLLMHDIYCHPKYKNQLQSILKAVALHVKDEELTEKLYYSDSGNLELTSILAEIGSMVSCEIK